MILTVPRGHQVEAVEKAKPFDGFCFFGQMRTGKCLQSLMLVDYWRPTDLVIICPKIAVDEWHRQIKRHILIDWPIGIHVLTYEYFRAHRHEWYDWGYKCHSLMIILDEAHAVKKRGSSQSMACRTFGKRAYKRLVLTGTPIAQGRHDAWALFDFIQSGLVGKYSEFEEKFLKTLSITNPATGAQWKKITGYKNTEEFDRIFHKYSHRITLNEARKQAGKLPIRTRRQFVEVELEPAGRRFYNKLDQELEADFNGHFFETPNTMTLIMKLQQLCGGWIKDDAGYWMKVEYNKFKKLYEILKNPSMKWPVVIVCRYLQEFAEIVEMLQHSFGIDPIQLKGGEKFDGKFENEAAVLQIQSGKAVDLSVARSIIFYSCDYSLINFDQIRYRIRSFDVSQVNEYYLHVKNTVDGLIYKAITKKLDLATLVCDLYRSRKAS